MDGKRSKGRPRRMWIDDIKEWTNVGEHGQLKRKAQYREQWRSMIGNLRTLEDAKNRKNRTTRSLDQWDLSLAS